LRLEFPPPPRNVVAPIFRTFRGKTFDGHPCFKCGQAAQTA